jgi:hypothetical protein
MNKAGSKTKMNYLFISVLYKTGTAVTELEQKTSGLL